MILPLKLKGILCGAANGRRQSKRTTIALQSSSL